MRAKRGPVMNAERAEQGGGFRHCASGTGEPSPTLRPFNRAVSAVRNSPPRKEVPPIFPDDSFLRQTIFRALRAALSLTDPEADASIIRAYADVPAAEQPGDANLCYYHLRTDAQAKILQEAGTEASLRRVHSFIPCSLILVFYGPACETWAHACRSFLFLDGASRPRQILREAGLYPIPFPPPPSIVYEETGKAFRKRADLVISLRLVDESSYGSVISRDPTPVETIQSAPTVSIHLSGLHISPRNP